MRRKLDEEHLLSLCEPGDYGIFAPPMAAQVAVDELCRYFLGDDWYDASGVTNAEQINTNIVAEIEQKYKGAKISRLRHNKFDADHICGICDTDGWNSVVFSPPMKAQVAVYELCRYFLGDNWYDASGANHPEQVNTSIVYNIERQYRGVKIKRNKLR